MVLAHNENKKNNNQRGIIDAFYCAYFHRVEKLSGNTLQKVLQQMDRSEKHEMTDEEMFEAAKRMIGG